jgi:hypothetical protein
MVPGVKRDESFAGAVNEGEAVDDKPLDCKGESVLLVTSATDAMLRSSNRVGSPAKPADVEVNVSGVPIATGSAAAPLAGELPASELSASALDSRL